ncbi:hypothetical protein [Ruminococcus sp. Marseille-P6503]|uniref:hypothetical protein n=1 Tax=Ruminococcus sp. Marseille-P6503 TaxID=2364796 RepID=UPI000F53CB17|nr:hypothetical protein [Ruminococcus sp. Marseille-P6503]
MSIKKIAAIICALSMTTAMLASCGDTDDSSSSSSSAADTASSAAAAADSAAESVAEESAAESAADSAAVDELEVWEPITEFAGYDAFLMFGDNEWLWGNWEGTGYPDATQAFGNDADVTGDGEYTVSITNASIIGTDDLPNAQVAVDENTGLALPATGSVVFCVDITGICDGTKNYKGEEIKKNSLKEGDDANVNKETAGKYVGDELTVEVTSIKADGKEVEFDPSKIVYGNIEDNNNCYRIEIYNTYGPTAEDPPIDVNALTFEEELSVTFNISGLTEEG